MNIPYRICLATVAVWSAICASSASAQALKPTSDPFGRQLEMQQRQRRNALQSANPQAEQQMLQDLSTLRYWNGERDWDRYGFNLRRLDNYYEIERVLDEIEANPNPAARSRLLLDLDRLNRDRRGDESSRNLRRRDNYRQMEQSIRQLQAVNMQQSIQARPSPLVGQPARPAPRPYHAKAGSAWVADPQGRLRYKATSVTPLPLAPVMRRPVPDVSEPMTATTRPAVPAEAAPEPAASPSTRPAKAATGS